MHSIPPRRRASMETHADTICGLDVYLFCHHRTGMEGWTLTQKRSNGCVREVSVLQAALYSGRFF
jgi:hypothetical protein